MVNDVSKCTSEALLKAWDQVKECAPEQIGVVTQFLKSVVCTANDKVLCPVAHVVDSVFRKHFGWVAFIGGAGFIFKGVSNLTHLVAAKNAHARRDFQTKAIVEIGLGIIGVVTGTVLIV